VPQLLVVLLAVAASGQLELPLSEEPLPLVEALQLASDTVESEAELGSGQGELVDDTQDELILRDEAKGGDESRAEIVSGHFTQDEEGGYSSSIATSNDISQSVSGYSTPGQEPETGSYYMSGEYSYLTPEGQLISVTWYADETGYHPTSDAIPRPVKSLF